MSDDARVRVARAMAELVTMQVEPFGIQDLAQVLVERATELAGVWAAGLLLVDPGSTPKVLAASTHAVGILELVQVRSGEGPCLAAIEREEVTVVDALDDVRAAWPHWTPEAEAIGLRRAYGIPLRARDGVVGALNLFVRDDIRLDADDLEIAAALAQVATVGILHHRALGEAATLADQLQRALESRVLVEQAKGALSARAGISVPEAFERLRRHARTAGRPIAVVARDVIDGAVDLAP